MPTRPEIQELQETLKQLIAVRRLRLSDMAVALDISIATAKRLLNGDDLSVERMLAVCDWIGIRFHEVVEIATRRRTEYHFCTLEQEDFLASHPEHFAFLRALQKGESIVTIRASTNLSILDCQAYLSDLAAQGFLIFSESQDVTLRVKDGMDWRPGGSLWKTFFARWGHETVEHTVAQAGLGHGSLDISQRKLSEKSFQDLKRELDELSRKYASISRLEREMHSSEKLKFCTCLFIADIWTAPIWEMKPYPQN